MQAIVPFSRLVLASPSAKNASAGRGVDVIICECRAECSVMLCRLVPGYFCGFWPNLAVCVILFVSEFPANFRGGYRVIYNRANITSVGADQIGSECEVNNVNRGCTAAGSSNPPANPRACT